MDVKEENICRLCFNIVVKGFGFIDEVTKEMLHVLSLNMNLDISENPIICQECTEITEKCYCFKLACLGTEKHLSCTTDNREVKSEFNDLNKNCIETDTNEDLRCRFCMIQLERDDCITVEYLMNDAMLVKMLPELMQEIDLSVMSNPIVCVSCRDNLERYLKFVQNCRNIEEKINIYCQDGGTGSTGQVKLSNIIPVLLDSVVLKQEVNKVTEAAVYEDVTNAEETTGIKFGEHNSNVNRGLLYQCTMCDFMTKHKSSISRHILTHMDATEVHMYRCALCAYKTKRKDCLKDHMRTHRKPSDVKTYKCVTCSFETKSKLGLKGHILMHKDVSEAGMYKCTICSYGTKQKGALKGHMRKHKDHMEVRKNKCVECSYETKFKNNLRKHAQTHMEYKK